MGIDKSVDKLIDDSGIITHYKVIDKLKESGWSVLISPYYYDNIANSIREIDIVAEKQFNSSTSLNSSVQINVQLFIECKYIKQEIVFWFDDKDIDGAVLKLERDTGLTILHNKSSADIQPEKFHYLGNKEVARLFSTNTNKEDVVYKAITQCLNSKIYYDQWFHRPINFEFIKSGKVNTKILKYPVVICNNFDKLLKINFVGDKYEYENIKGPFQVEINYTYLDKTKTQAIAENFWIDVVNFDNLDNFLKIVEQEIKAVMEAKIFLLR